jgi:hypothetical protein
MKLKITMLVAAMTMTVSLRADILKLKNGSGIQGTLISANSREILFLGVDGSQGKYAIGLQGIALHLAASPAPKPHAAPAVPRP